MILRDQRKHGDQSRFRRAEGQDARGKFLLR
jgi:hypothetical protein